VLKKLVGNDPAAAARYFDRLVLLFIKHVLGWDADLQRSYKGGGLFGFTQAFFGATETQGQVSVVRALYNVVLLILYANAVAGWFAFAFDCLVVRSLADGCPETRP
jgi:hypothetical protein